MKRRLFVDLDGTLNEWNFNLPSPDALYEEGYFINRPPHENMIRAVRALIELGEDVYILSAVLSDSKYALFEKHDWLDKYLPIDCKRRVFSICGEDKISAVPAFNPDTDILIDDYGENCRTWEAAGGLYVKVSTDESDAAKERDRHKYVVHPDLSAFDIITYLRNEVPDGKADKES